MADLTAKSFSDKLTERFGVAPALRFLKNHAAKIESRLSGEHNPVRATIMLGNWIGTGVSVAITAIGGLALVETIFGAGVNLFADTFQLHLKPDLVMTQPEIAVLLITSSVVTGAGAAGLWGTASLRKFGKTLKETPPSMTIEEGRRYHAMSSAQLQA